MIRAGAKCECTQLDHFLTARWGLHVRWWGRTLSAANRHEVWPVHDAPDHAAITPGVFTEFGFPPDATRLRRH